MSDYMRFIDLNRKHYILYAEDNNENRFYIANTNPITWTSVFIEAKTYLTSRNAEFDVVCNYDNYRILRQMLDNGSITGVYLTEVTNGVETGRLKLLWIN